MFNNGMWAIQKLRTSIPQDPFEVWVDGNPMGKAKLLAFARNLPNTDKFPQALVLYASGYLRLKAGADPKPPLPFGQSLVLGPAIWGTSASSPSATLFFHPQIQRVAIDTSRINRDGANRLLIRVTASNAKRSPGSTTTNKIMNLAWTLTLDEPGAQATVLDVAGTFEFTEAVIPEPAKTARGESVRLMQVSSLFIDGLRHDVDAFRFRNADGVVTLPYDPGLANVLLPVIPTALDPETLMFESLQTDDAGQPNGNTPSYRITINSTTGPLDRPHCGPGILQWQPKPKGRQPGAVGLPATANMHRKRCGGQCQLHCHREHRPIARRASHFPKNAGSL